MLGQFSAQEVAKPTFKAPTLRRNGQTFANDMIFTLRQKIKMFQTDVFIFQWQAK